MYLFAEFERGVELNILWSVTKSVCLSSMMIVNRIICHSLLSNLSILGLQCCDFCQLLSDFTFKVQSFMTIYIHHRLLECKMIGDR